FSTAITYAGWSTSGYNNFQLNAGGLAAISTTSIAKFGTRDALYDVANSAPPWTPGQASYSVAYYADQAGTSQDPKLTVITNTGPIAPTDLLAEGQTSPTSVSDLTPEFSAIFNDPDRSEEHTSELQSRFDLV